uniref:Uncharacterized protein n=1 Tax=Tetraselmis sp. GSL018 TaxID=582737 RepID=A0A061S1A1_9CHLO|mmetsp:Transcript_38335/g.90911  ORF Transcript_38335/g.90911 Transcript_38335/m.90911 type:complete len:253 (+) Transcript_38335:214-972(+)
MDYKEPEETNLENTGNPCLEKQLSGRTKRRLKKEARLERLLVKFRQFQEEKDSREEAERLDKLRNAPSPFTYTKFFSKVRSMVGGGLSDIELASWAQRVCSAYGIDRGLQAQFTLEFLVYTAIEIYAIIIQMAWRRHAERQRMAWENGDFSRPLADLVCQEEFFWDERKTADFKAKSAAAPQRQRQRSDAADGSGEEAQPRRGGERPCGRCPAPSPGAPRQLVAGSTGKPGRSPSKGAERSPRKPSSTTWRG